VSPHAFGTVVAGAAFVVALSACATTFDETLVADTSPATTTTLPSGSAAELLPQLQIEASGLSAVMIADGDDDVVAEQITNLWNAARDEVRSERPDLVDGFDRSIAMIAKAVKFHRAADADKAASNLTTLINAYLP
jgi:hypothetical protein